jgi:hypothetical protein
MEIEDNFLSEEEQKKEFENRYNERVLQLQCQNGWSPRQAKRAMESIMKKKLKQFIKKGKQRKEQLEKAGKTFTAELEE